MIRDGYGVRTIPTPKQDREERISELAGAREREGVLVCESALLIGTSISCSSASVFSQDVPERLDFLGLH